MKLFALDVTFRTEANDQNEAFEAITAFLEEQSELLKAEGLSWNTLDEPTELHNDLIEGEPFAFYSTPGHGYLIVGTKDIEDLGLVTQNFTAYSYRNHRGILALEEDCDSVTFQKAFFRKHKRLPRLAVHDTNQTNPFQNWDSIN